MESISICDFPIFAEPLTFETMSFDISVFKYLYFTVEHSNYVTSSIPEVLVVENWDARQDDVYIIRKQYDDRTRFGVLVTDESLASETRIIEIDILNNANRNLMLYIEVTLNIGSLTQTDDTEIHSINVYEEDVNQVPMFDEKLSPLSVD